MKRVITPFSIEKAWGDSVENALIEDALTAIKETLQMDNEHGAFWVSDENENVLEFHKDLNLFFTYDPDNIPESLIRLDSPEDAEQIYRLFFEGKIDAVKALFRQ